MATIGDRAGNRATNEVAFSIDITPPQVQITWPGQDTALNVTPISLLYTVDGQPRSREISLEEGVNVIVVDSTDLAGNRGVDTVIVELDTVAPVVKIVSPEDGTTTDLFQIAVVWTVEGVEQTEETWQDLVEGENIIVRGVADVAGNRGADSIKVVVETDAPLAAITSPPPGYISRSPEVAFRVDVLTPSVVTTEFRVDGVDRSSEFILADKTYTALLQTVEGHHVFEVLVESISGRRDTVRTSFVVNTRPVETQISISGTVVNGRSFEPVSGAVAEVIETGSTAHTDAEGRFVLASGGFGTLRVQFHAKGYASAIRLIGAAPGLDVSLPPVIVMPLDTNRVTVYPGADTTVVLPNGVELDVPAEAVSQPVGITATLYDHVDQLPNMQPGRDVFVFCVRIESDGHVEHDSMRVRVPNRRDLTAGACDVVTLFDTITGEWMDYGLACVTPDGSAIEFHVSHLSTATFHGNGHAAGGGGTPGGGAAGGDGHCDGTTGNSGSSFVTTRMGDLQLEYTVDGGHALTNIDARLVYWASTAAPRKVIWMRLDDIPFTPTYCAWKVYLPGVSKEWLFHGPSASTGFAYEWNAAKSDGTFLSTGLYPYGLRISDIMMPGRYRYDIAAPANWYISYTEPTAAKYYYYGFTTVVNRQDSPYGAGWTIDGVTRIVTKKWELPGEFPDATAYRAIDALERTATPGGDSLVAALGTSTALARTLAGHRGEHVAIVGSNSYGDVYSWTEGNHIYTPPYGSHDTLVFVNPGWVRNLADGTVEQYDSRGLLATRTDPHGNTTEYIYDAFGERLLSITDVSTGATTRLRYDGRDRLVGIIDQYGRTTMVTVDAEGDLAEIVTPDSRTIRRYTYDSEHRATTKWIPDGGSSTYEYNEWGAIENTISPAGLLTRYDRRTDPTILNTRESVAEGVFEGFGISTGSVPDYSSQTITGTPDVSDAEYRFADNVGDTVVYEFDSYNHVALRRNAKDEATRYSFDQTCRCGMATTVEYPNGLVITRHMDERGNQISSHNSATGASTAYTYTTIQGIDHVETTTNALGQKTSFGYDERGNLTVVVDAAGDSTRISYDQHSLPTHVTDALGRTVVTVYDSQGRIVARISPAGDTTRYEYDAFGNVSRMMRPLDRTTEYTYDIMGRLLAETDAAGSVTRYTYAPSGRLDSLIDANGHATTFGYDSAGNLTEVTNHQGVSRHYRRDQQGKLVAYTNARGKTVLYAYDDLKRLVQKATDDTTVLTRFGYDNMGNMTYAATADYVVNRGFDQAGRMLQEITHSYRASDTLGRRDTIEAGDLRLDYADLLIDGDTVVIDGEHHFNSLRLTNGALLQHLPTDAHMVHRLVVFARDLIQIDGSSRIDASGLGYLGGGRSDNDTTVGRTNGNSLAGGSSPGSGGSHGGRGGRYQYYGDTIGYAAAPFDSRLWPVQPGGGGGSNGNPGYNGGGVVHLNAPLVVIDGVVAADGETAHSSNGGGGAGGSVIIEADTLRGLGLVSASGGKGIALGGGTDGGGGGGRVFVSAASSRGEVRLEAFGGDFGAGAGSIVVFGPSGFEVEQVVVEADSVLRIAADDNTKDGADLLIDSATVIVDGEHEFSNVTLRNCALLTHETIEAEAPESNAMHLLVTGAVTVDSSSRIDVSGKGYRGGNGSLCAHTRAFECGSDGSSGGSHGGSGGAQAGYNGYQYGSVREPTSAGAGGSALNENAVLGGAGGGVVHLTTPKMRLDGVVVANGETAEEGAGAGGSIALDVDSLFGRGIVQADGGQSWIGGGGGGGWVALLGVEMPSLPTGNVTAYGGFGSVIGSPGTVYLEALDSVIYRNPDYGSDSVIVVTGGTFSIGQFDRRYEGMGLRFTNAVVSIAGAHTFRQLTMDSCSTVLTGTLHVLDSVAFRRGTVVSHRQTTHVDEYRLALSVQGDFALDPSSRIDVTGCGYVGDQLVNGQWVHARTVGNLPGSQSGNRHCAGGSYGGQGGTTHPTVLPASWYGHFFVLNELGSGGGTDLSYNSGAYPGGDGGGFVRLSAPRMTVDGQIIANGAPGAWWPSGWKGAGGSGGGIRLWAETIVGSGQVHADGGMGKASGGGGRVAIECDSMSNAIALTALSGGAGGNGTVCVRKHAKDGDTVVITNPATADTSYRITAVIGEADTLFEQTNVTVAGNGLQIDGEHVFGSLRIVDGRTVVDGASLFGHVAMTGASAQMTGQVHVAGDLVLSDGSLLSHRPTTHLDEYRLVLDIEGQLTVDSTSRIDASGCGYVGNQLVEGEWTQARTLGNLPGSQSDNWHCAGGSYGGDGGTTQPATLPAATYGDFWLPDEPGSGGGADLAYNDGGYPGGDGGGFLYVSATRVRVDGEIVANGANGALWPYGGWKSAGGSGGGICLLADSVMGTGRVHADGGDGKAGGGGGRVAVACDSLSDALALSALGAGNGHNGTVFARVRGPAGETVRLVNPAQVDSSYRVTAKIAGTDTLFEGRDIEIAGSGLEVIGEHTFGDVTVAGGLLRSEGRLTVDTLVLRGTFGELTGTVLAHGNIRFTEGSHVTHKPTTQEQEHKLALQAQGVVEVDSTSMVDVSARGYCGDQVVDGQWAGARTLGNVKGSASAVRTCAGGSYGGVALGPSPNPVYGDFYAPSELGSGGGARLDYNDGKYRGGNGGGFVSMEAARVCLNGLVRSSGGDGASYTYGFWAAGGSGGGIRVLADTVTGRGTIVANGGLGLTCGSGGRIAVRGEYLSDSLTLTCRGAGGSAPGTVFRRDSSRPLGVLSVDNGGTNAPNNSTPLIAIAEGAVTHVTADSLTDTTAVFSPFVQGHQVKPNYDYVSTEDAFTVVAVDPHVLVVDTSTNTLTRSAVAGDPYIGVYHLDSIAVTGGARVVSEGLFFYDALTLDNGTFTDHRGIQIDGMASMSQTEQPHDAATSWKDIAKQGPNVAREQKRNPPGLRTALPVLEADSLPTEPSSKKDLPTDRQIRHVPQTPAWDTIPQGLLKAKGLDSLGPRENALGSDSLADGRSAFQEPEEGRRFRSRFRMPGERYAMLASTGPGALQCLDGDPVYTHDKLDRVTSMTSPVGTTYYVYDAISGRLEKIVSPDGKEFTYGYDRGQLGSLERPNGIVTHYDFDDNGNLVSLDHRLGASSLRSYAYTYDANGLRTGMTDVVGTHDYAYDQLYQIVEATHPTVSNPLEQFEYDPVGNWQGNGRVHNELNQLLEDDSCWYQYDADGNMTLRLDKVTGDSTVYTWDIENRLTRVDMPSGTVVEYVYGPLGRRLAKVVDGERKEFRYDGEDLIMEMNSRDSVVASYTFGPGIDQPLAMNRNGRNYYYLTDGLGSVTAITDESGTPVQEYVYSVFGEIVEQSADSIENSFAFTGREWDNEAGLHHYRNRYYGPQIGRFISEDPLGIDSDDGPQLYWYARNNPVLFTDPWGTQCGSKGSDPVVPEKGLGWDFTKCCEDHDCCYGKAGKTRKQCDKDFLQCMTDSCKGAPTRGLEANCKKNAKLYYRMVRWFGGGAYGGGGGGAGGACGPPSCQ